jgi:dipeptidase E
MKSRHIFAMGDNGFRKDPNSHALYHTLLRATQTPKPKVCLIPTASGDAQDYIDAFYSQFQNYECEISHLSLFRGETEAIEKQILDQDLIYVTGGNTRNMLVLWKEWGVDRMLKKAYENGTVMAGGSAGSLCWFSAGVTDSIPGRFSSMDCLAWLKESNCPHYDELTRRHYYLRAVKTGELKAGYSAENGVALHFENERFFEAISPYQNKFAYYVEQLDSEAKEIAILARHLP